MGDPKRFSRPSRTSKADRRECLCSKVSDLLKKFHKRSLNFLIFFTLFVLTDEYIKEGYLFKIEEVLTPLTHENILVVVWAIVGIINLIYAFFKRKNMRRH